MTTAQILEATTTKRHSLTQSYKTNKLDQKSYLEQMVALANTEAKLLRGTK
jgi:hypothetical protein